MRKKIFFLAILLVCASFAFAENKPILVAADLWPPFIDPDHPKQGLSIEIIRAAYETQGYKITLKILPWARAEDGVTHGTYDILANTWKTKKRTEVLSFSQPYATNYIKFIKRKKTVFEYDGLHSLAGKTVGTILGYGYDDAFMKATGFTREETSKLIYNLKKLIDHRIDLTLADEIVAKTTLAKKNKALLNKIAFVKKPLSIRKLFVTSGLQNARHKELIDAFNKGLTEIKSNGTYKIILESYGIKQPPNDPRQL